MLAKIPRVVLLILLSFLDINCVTEWFLQGVKQQSFHLGGGDGRVPGDCTGRDHDRPPVPGSPGSHLEAGQSRALQFWDAGALATAEVRRFRPVGRVVVTVRGGAVFFNVLASGLVYVTVAVGLVVVGLLVTLAADETTVRRGNNGARRVLGKPSVDVAGRQRVPVNRLDTESHTSAP
jgi:hypothetical protein